MVNTNGKWERHHETFHDVLNTTSASIIGVVVSEVISVLAVLPPLLRPPGSFRALNRSGSYERVDRCAVLEDLVEHGFSELSRAVERVEDEY